MNAKRVLTVLLMFAVSFMAHGQADKPARLRVMQLSYVLDVSALVDVAVDGNVLFEEISFPFVTDYVVLAPGEHELTTSISGRDDYVASLTLTLEAGTDYFVIVEGDYAQGVNYMVIVLGIPPDSPAQSAAIVANLTSLAITDLAVDDQLVVESVTPGDYATLALPNVEFAVSGSFGDQSYSETFTPHSNTRQIIAVRQQPSGEPMQIYDRSSWLSVADYLRSVEEGAQFSRVAAAIVASGALDALSDDHAFTLFLPVNGALDGVDLPTDAETLIALLSDHVVIGSLSPYLLPRNATVTTLSGAVIAPDFGSTPSGYWEIDGAPILWDIRLPNGVIYGIDGVIDLSR
ncbi:MAG: fasciclin domain-containing protein [Chloroflexi bacterium]|nr:fasciclin domain-containing protein [Chloroflexota bacterium]